MRIIVLYLAMHAYMASRMQGQTARAEKLVSEVDESTASQTNEVLACLLLALEPSAALRLPVARTSFANAPLRAGASLSEIETKASSGDTPTLFKEQRGNLALLDEQNMILAQKFPFTAEELIAKAKDFISADYGADDNSMLADSFQFIGPFIGPLDRQQYLNALGGNLNPSDGFPDLIGRQFGFSVDPVEAGRVWWFTRPVGTFTKPFFGADPDGRRIETPPQAMGVVFDSDGLVRKINVGAVVDRTSGNTGGLGGLFGFLWFVGKSPPAPEYQPYKQSWQFKLINFLGATLAKLGKT